MKLIAKLAGKSVLMLTLAMAFGLSVSLASAADNVKADYVGKIDSVHVTPYGTRFIANSQGLNLYTNHSAYRQVLLEGLNRKQDLTISYRPMSCPAGIAGTCGIVSTVLLTQATP